MGLVEKDRKCSNCGGTKTHWQFRRSDGFRWPTWRKDSIGGYLCTYCFDKQDWANNGKEIWARKRAQRQGKYIDFLDKGILMTWVIRKGICKICEKTKKTVLHHYFYIPCMPWTCTIELCRSHHIRQHIDRAMVKL